MQRRPARENRYTPGERQVAFAYLAVFLFGAVLSSLIVLRLGQGNFVFNGRWAYGMWICLSGGLGAGLALYLVRDRLGHPGMAGAVQAAMGMLAMCLAASLIGGTLALPLYGTMFGPFMLGVTFVASPLLALTWVLTLTAVHLVMLRWRTERNSIFDARLRGPGPAP